MMESVCPSVPLHAHATFRRVLAVCLQIITIMDIDLALDEAVDWFAEHGPRGRSEDRQHPDPDQLPKLHLLLGDSIAKASRLTPRDPGDRILSRARGGETWRSLSRYMEEDVRVWQDTMEAEERAPGYIIIWCSGNDVYHRQGPLVITSHLLDRVAALATSVVGRLEPHAEKVYVFGPLPRLLGADRGAKWERTAASHLERRLINTRLGDSCEMIRLGRSLTKKMTKNTRAVADAGYHHTDGVHLSPAGYERIGACGAFPGWLRM